MVAAGFPSAASHWATTTDLEPAWTVTILAEFLGLAREAERKQKYETDKDMEVKKLEGTISWKSKFDTITTIIYKKIHKRDKVRKDTNGENKMFWKDF